jgi:hypothetical protein
MPPTAGVGTPALSRVALAVCSALLGRVHLGVSFSAVTVHKTPEGSPVLPTGGLASSERGVIPTTSGVKEMGAATGTVTSEGGSRALGSSGAIVEGSLSGTAKDKGSRLGPKSPRVAFICLSCRQVGMKSTAFLNSQSSKLLIDSVTTTSASLTMCSRQKYESRERKRHLIGRLWGAGLLRHHNHLGLLIRY